MAAKPSPPAGFFGGGVAAGGCIRICGRGA
jgi:hypothetical protein